MIILKKANMRIFKLSLLILLSSSSIAVAESRTAEQIYNTACATCHATGVANAPKANDSAAWKARAKTIEQLVASSKKGLNAMPPMGLCADCTDDELKTTIKFMMSEKKE